MKHDLNDLIERLKFNREHNLSFDSSDLIEEVNEESNFTVVMLKLLFGATLKIIS